MTSTTIKRGAALAVGGVLVGSAATTLMAARYQEAIAPEVRIGPVNVGGLTQEQAARKLRVWWNTERLRKVDVRIPGWATSPGPITLAALGFVLEDEASVSDLPTLGFWENVGHKVGFSKPVARQLQPVWSLDKNRWKSFAAFVDRNRPPFARAKVTLKGEQYVRSYESSRTELDVDALANVLSEGPIGRDALDLPLKVAEKMVPDQAVDGIRYLMARYTTRFPVRQTDRNQNILLASSRIDGLILMPGESFSFNGVVGRRTVKDGFRSAPVFANGRHDTGVGGGICQVSSTLYNAALLSDLKIVRRQNHSIPVAYVPLGRDATVDFGNIDFSFQNNTGKPIALASKFEKGRLTFAVLGSGPVQKQVKIVTEHLDSWSHEDKVVVDKTLRPGTRKIVDKGGRGHRVAAYRVVQEAGQKERRERLGTSVYRGGPRIVAVGPPAAEPVAPPLAGQTN